MSPEQRKEAIAESRKRGWFNWYVNRGRLPLHPTKRELRALSWRRVI